MVVTDVHVYDFLIDCSGRIMIILDVHDCSRCACSSAAVLM